MKEKLFPVSRKTVVGRCSECRALCHEFKHDRICHACSIEMMFDRRKTVLRHEAAARASFSHPDILIPGVRK
jgi:hypothetical protein